MKKKFLSVFLTLVMVVTVLPKVRLNVNAAEVKVNIGELEFILNDETSKASIEGVSGELPEKLTIPATVNWEDKTFEVNRINNGAFKGNKNIKEVEVPNGVTEIGNNAFLDSSLVGITLPNSVEKIGSQACFMCRNLKNINLPNNNKYETISSALFALCTDLENLIIPDNVTKIEPSAFTNSSLKNIKIPNSVEEIGWNAFAGCEKLETINLPENSNYNCIKKNTFSNCISLENIEIPNNIKELGEGAFSGAGLKGITIPDSVNKCGWSVFCRCEKLEAVNLPKSSGFKEISPRLFWGCKELGNIEISDNIDSIGAESFGSTGLKNIKIPNSVTRIGYEAFSDCEKLEAIELPENSEYNRMEQKIFYNCKSLENIKVPSSVNKFERRAFSGTGLENIAVPANVDVIEEGAFADCKNLQAIDLSKNNKLTEIADNLFNGCESLKAVILPDSVGRIGKDAFKGVKVKSINIPAELSKNYKEYFKGMDLAELEGLTISNNVSDFDLSTFSRCKNLRKLVIGYSSKLETLTVKFDSTDERLPISEVHICEDPSGEAKITKIFKTYNKDINIVNILKLDGASDEALKYLLQSLKNA